MYSCGKSRELFPELRKICLALKNDELLPYIINFGDKILEYNHVEAFLKLLGFTRQKSKKIWICVKDKRVATQYIDFAIMKIHETLQVIKRHTSVKNMALQLRQKAPTQPQPLTVITSETFDEMYNTDVEEEDMKQDADSVQLYELIWGITHLNNEDHSAKDVLLLTYPLVTTAKLCV